MKRLTTDNPKGNFETMMNFAYAKDGRVILRYGAEKDDIDLCEYMERVTDSRCGGAISKDFEDGACFECDCDCSFGILYTVAVQAAELRARLMDYEDREEQSGGEWVYGEDDSPYCSECRYEPREITPYCPNCGAHMEDDEEEQ